MSRIIPILEIEYQDGTVDIAVSVPIRFLEHAQILLGLIRKTQQLDAKVEQWIQEVCAEVIVVNRKQRGIEYLRMTQAAVVELFFSDGDRSLSHLIEENARYPKIPDYLKGNDDLELSDIPVANTIATIACNPKLGANLEAFLELDAATVYETLIQIWIRTEDPEKRADRNQDAYLESDEFLNSNDAKIWDAMYQQELNNGRQN